MLLYDIAIEFNKGKGNNKTCFTQREIYNAILIVVNNFLLRGCRKVNLLNYHLRFFVRYVLRTSKFFIV